MLTHGALSFLCPPPCSPAAESARTTARRSARTAARGGGIRGRTCCTARTFCAAAGMPAAAFAMGGGVNFMPPCLFCACMDNHKRNIQWNMKMTLPSTARRLRSRGRHDGRHHRDEQGGDHGGDGRRDQAPMWRKLSTSSGAVAGVPRSVDRRNTITHITRLHRRVRSSAAPERLIFHAA